MDDFVRPICGAIGVILLTLKELFSALARDRVTDADNLSKKNRIKAKYKMDDRARWLEDLAAICGLFAAVFGLPALFSAVFK